MKQIVLLVSAALLSGCASILTGTTQTIAVSTTPMAGASCDLTNDKGHWTVFPTPGISTVGKSASAMTVTCSDHNGSNTGTTSVQSVTGGAVFGNLLLGGLIGTTVDMVDGAAFNYPPSIAVPLAPAPVAQSRVEPTAPVIPVVAAPAGKPMM